MQMFKGFFSQAMLIKTKSQNKLQTTTVDALLMAKQGLPCCVPVLTLTLILKCKDLNNIMYDYTCLFEGNSCRWSGEI